MIKSRYGYPIIFTPRHAKVISDMVSLVVWHEHKREILIATLIRDDPPMFPNQIRPTEMTSDIGSRSHPANESQTILPVSTHLAIVRLHNIWPPTGLHPHAA